MLAPIALAALLASALVVRAEVVPSEPGPGTVANQGTTCHISWQGDTDSPTAWKDMSIQLMSGSNVAMVHLTTVSTAPLDGTQSGTFDYPCPAVTPNSAIYFYQFTAPGAPVKTWTTRFAIASSSGQTVPPANKAQPDGDPVPWGVGALVDPSTAKPPPAGIPGSTATSSVVLSVTSTLVASPSPSSSALPRPSQSITPSRVAASSASSSSASASSTPANAAMGGVVVDKRVWQAAVALGASALAFTVLL